MAPQVMTGRGWGRRRPRTRLLRRLNGERLSDPARPLPVRARGKEHVPAETRTWRVTVASVTLGNGRGPWRSHQIANVSPPGNPTRPCPGMKR